MPMQALMGGGHMQPERYKRVGGQYDTSATLLPEKNRYQG